MEYQEIKLLKESEKNIVHLVQERDSKQLFVRKILKGQQPVYLALQKYPHPHLPQLYEVVLGEDSTTVIEEYIEGKTPDTIDLSETQFLAIVDELCSVLDFIHEKGIIHRDIKPSNLILTPEGHIYLIDFDTARMPSGDQEQDTRRLGTRGYAPPEQYGFSQTDKRADIYSMGVTLTQLLDDSYQKTRYQKILRKCTDLNPDKRFQSAGQVKDAFLHPNRKKIRYGGFVAAAVVLVALLWGYTSKKLPFVEAPPVQNTEEPPQKNREPADDHTEDASNALPDDLFTKNEELPSLMAPGNPHWIENTGIASWGNVLNSGNDGNFKYMWRLYRKDIETPPDLEKDTWLIAESIMGNSYGKYDFQLNLSPYFTENGFYYFAVSAMGDNVNYTDSVFTLSDVFEYTGESAPPLPAPTAPFWNIIDTPMGTQYYAFWSNLEDYEDLDTFNVTVYNKDGEYVINNMWSKEFIQSVGNLGIQLYHDYLTKEGGPYRFTVQVFSSRPNDYSASLLPTPPTEEYLSPEFIPTF